MLIVGEGDFQEYWKLAEDLKISGAVSFPGVKKSVPLAESGKHLCDDLFK